jgi:hypothetical protein
VSRFQRLTDSYSTAINVLMGEKAMLLGQGAPDSKSTAEGSQQYFTRRSSGARENGMLD